MHRLKAEVKTTGQMDAFIELEPKLVEGFGAGKRPPVRTTINGHPYVTRVMVYGGKYLIGIRKDVQKAANAGGGEVVDLTIELDEQPREVQVPSDFADAMTHAGVRQRYDALSFTNRREYARWIEEAKREETRRSRLEKAIVMLRDGVRTPG